MVHDPVAQSIRNEQMADAAPTPDEHRREHRTHLASEGCEVCEEDDPDKLQDIRYEVVHYCSMIQQPPEHTATVILCDEHERSSTELTEAHFYKCVYENEPDAELVAHYSCGHYEVRGPPTEHNHPYAGFESVPEVPTVHTTDGCGGRLERIEHIGDNQ